jgi:hypothetical protein
VRVTPARDLRETRAGRKQTTGNRSRPREWVLPHANRQLARYWAQSGNLAKPRTRARERADKPHQKTGAGRWYARPPVEVFERLGRGFRAIGARVRAAKLTLGVSIALIAIVGAYTLTRSPPRVVRASSPGQALVATTIADASFCQTGETLPAGVSGIRLSVWAYFGANIHVTVSSGSRTLTAGQRGPDWTGSTVTIPVTPLRHAVSPVKVCVDVGPNSEVLYFMGRETHRSDAAVASTGEPLAGRLGIEYLVSGKRSWWSRILEVARHMGLGHALTGTWIVGLIAALMAAVGGLAIRVALRELS